MDARLTKSTVRNLSRKGSRKAYIVVYPFGPLRSKVEPKDLRPEEPGYRAKLARTLKVSPRTISRFWKSGVDTWLADEIACRELGAHPTEVWDKWGHWEAILDEIDELALIPTDRKKVFLKEKRKEKSKC